MVSLSPLRESVKHYAEELVNGRIERDPVEDTAEDLWKSLRMLADQYLELLADYQRLMEDKE